MGASPTARRANVRARIEQVIIAVMRYAEARALDPISAAQRAFPHFPPGIIAECDGAFLADQSYEWWDRAENIIDVSSAKGAA